jgi:hypothetical protein
MLIKLKGQREWQDPLGDVPATSTHQPEGLHFTPSYFMHNGAHRFQAIRNSRLPGCAGMYAGKNTQAAVRAPPPVSWAARPLHGAASRVLAGKSAASCVGTCPARLHVFAPRCGGKAVHHVIHQPSARLDDVCRQSLSVLPPPLLFSGRHSRSALVFHKHRPERMSRC